MRRNQGLNLSFLLLIGLFSAACQLEERRQAIVEVPPGLHALKVTDEESVGGGFISGFSAFQKAKIELKNQRLENARRLIDQALQADSTDARYLYLSAKVYHAEEKMEKALNQAQRAQSFGLNYPDFLGFLAELYYQNEDLDRAMTYLQRGMEGEAQGKVPLNILAEIALKEQDTLRAEELYLSLWKNYKEERVAKKLYHLQDNHEKWLDTLLAYDIDPMFAWEEKARMSREKEEWDRAMFFTFNILDRVNPKHVPSLKELRSYLFDQYEVDSARFFHQQIVVLEKDSLDHLLWSARFADRQRKYYEASGLYQKLLEKDPEHQIGEEEYRKLRGKIAYLQQIEQEKERKDRLQAFPEIRSKKSDNQ